MRRVFHHIYSDMFFSSFCDGIIRTYGCMLNHRMFGRVTSPDCGGFTKFHLRIVLCFIFVRVMVRAP